MPDADAGVASAMVNTGQQIGTSIGTALLNTLAIAATTRYLTTRTLDGGRPGSGLPGACQAHGAMLAGTTMPTLAGGTALWSSRLDAASFGR